jgi:hypothetical protein
MGSPYKSESTDAEHRGGLPRSSGEVPVMGMERRGCAMSRTERIIIRDGQSSGQRTLRRPTYLSPKGCGDYRL